MRKENKFSGNLNEIVLSKYKDLPAIIKKFGVDGDERFLRELKAYRTYSDEKITPKVLLEGERTIILEYIPGKTLWELIQLKGEIDYKKLAETVSKISKSERKTRKENLSRRLSLNLEKMLKDIEKDGSKRKFAENLLNVKIGIFYNLIRLSINSLRGGIEKYGEEYLTEVFVHGDLKPSNIIISNCSGIRIVDWEFSHINSPYLDITQLAYKRGRFYSEPLIKELKSKKEFDNFLYDFFTFYNCVRIPLNIINMHNKYKKISVLETKKRVIEGRLVFLTENLLENKIF